MGTLSLFIPPDELDLYDGLEASIDDLLTETLTWQLMEVIDNKAEVCGELASYHSNNGGAPEVEDFSITDVTFDVATESGEFTLLYMICYFFTCSDMNSVSNAKQRWKYQLNRADGELELVTEEPMTRDTVDEF